MTKSDYNKIELELILKGYALDSFHAPIGYGCYLIINNQTKVKNKYDQEQLCTAVFKEKTARKRMLKWYLKNRAVVSTQQSH
jgi:hypothetical protein